MAEMTILDRLQQRIELATMAVRTEMISAKTDDQLLPYGEISVNQTADGVVVKFLAKSNKGKEVTKDT